MDSINNLCLIFSLSYLSFVHLIAIVPKCPLNESTWTERSKSFQCPIFERYHCLKDLGGNLVEACLEVTAFQNDDGCPIFHKTSGLNKIKAVKCLATTVLNGCPENSSGTFFSYETYKYHSCIGPDMKGSESFRTTETEKTEGTASRRYIHVSYFNSHAFKSMTSLSMEMEDAKTIMAFPDSEDNDVLVITTGAAVLMILVSVWVLWIFAFIRRRRKVNEIITDDVQYQPLYSNDLRDISVSPRTRAISFSTRDIERSLGEDEIAAGYSQDIYFNIEDDINEDAVFMTFEQL